MHLAYPHADSVRNACFFGLIALTGFSSLLYEITWIRRASLAFGSSSLAMATVLAAFFLGLGIGSYLAGRYVVRLRQPLIACALIELLLACNGAASLALFDWGETLYGVVYRLHSDETPLLLTLRAGMVGFLLLPPTLLMGATLPLFCRYAIQITADPSATVGQIYGINTLGATAGCATTGFLLLPELGLSDSLAIGIAANLLTCAGFGLLLRCNPTLPQAPVRHQQIAPKPNTIDRRLCGAILFILGVTALSNEVLWARFLTYFTRNSIYTYTASLTVVLLGTAAGSLLFSRYNRTAAAINLWQQFCTLQTIAATLPLVLTHLPVDLWFTLAEYGIAPLVCLMLIPATIGGACFPLLNRLLNCDNPHTAPRHMAAMLVCNIAGCIVGSLATGFGLLPHFGLKPALFATALAGLLAASLAWPAARVKRPTARIGRVIPLVLACGVTLCGDYWLNPPLRLPEDFLARHETLIDFTEGYNSSLAVVNREQHKTLLIDRLWQGVDRKNYQIMVAHIPMLHAPEAKDVLVIGLGTGTTASRFLDYNVTHLDIVDIEPRIFDFTRKHFPGPWLSDPRVRLLAEDGRHYVKHDAHRYDLLSVEIGQLDRPGVGVFYTREFYAEARAKLRDNGMISQFVPLRFLTPGDFVGIVKTFLSEFPNASLWYNTDELLLLGFNGGHRQPDAAKFEQLLQRPAIHNDLDFNYWGGPNFSLQRLPVLMAGFLATGQALQRLADLENIAVYSDDALQLSYSMSHYRRQQQRAKALVEPIARNLSPIAEAAPTLSSNDLDTAERIRQLNLGDIAAEDILRLLTTETLNRDAVQARRQIDEALRHNPRSLHAQYWRKTASLISQKVE